MSTLPKIKHGDVVFLTDERTVADLIAAKAANATQGLQMQVVRTRSIREQNGIVTWLVADLMAPQQPDLFLVLKIVDNAFDAKLMWRPDDMPIATRQELLGLDKFWLFQAPPGDKFKACDLKYTTSISVDDGKTVYNQKLAELHGECTESPRPSGVKQPSFATVMEYFTMQTVADPEIMVIELGGIDRNGDRIEDGGVVTYLRGAAIRSTDINIIAR